MIILGIDPGTLVTGYGLIHQHGVRLEALDYGCIRPPKSLSLDQRYKILFEALESLIDRYQPKVLAIESQFISKNVQSTIKLGMAKGMAILAAARKNMTICEYSPSQAKLAVTGTGFASKRQVQYMMQSLLSLSKPIEPEDAADALSLAFCHLHRSSPCTNR